MRTDMSTARRALDNHEYKAAAVLAGSVIEALLYWALQEQQGDVDRLVTGWLADASLNKRAERLKKRALERWDLADLIDVSEQLAILTATQTQMANVARQFRNLIHPGRVMAREGVNCTQGEAFAAVGAMYEIAELLERDGKRRGKGR